MNFEKRLIRGKGIACVAVTLGAFLVGCSATAATSPAGVRSNSAGTPGTSSGIGGALPSKTAVTGGDRDRASCPRPEDLPIPAKVKWDAPSPGRSTWGNPDSTAGVMCMLSSEGMAARRTEWPSLAGERVVTLMSMAGPVSTFALATPDDQFGEGSRFTEEEKRDVGAAACQVWTPGTERHTWSVLLVGPLQFVTPKQLCSELKEILEAVRPLLEAADAGR